MKKVLWVLAFVGVSALAQDSGGWNVNRGWFVGLSVGTSELSEQLFEDGDLVSDHSDDTAAFFGLNLGYQFNRYIGVETGYLKFGQMHAQNNANRVEFNIEGMKHMVYGRLPLGHRFALIAKLGLFYSHFDRSALPGNGSYNDSNWDTSFAFEMGATWRITPRLDATLEVGFYDLALLDFDWDYNNDNDDHWRLDGVSRSLQTAQVGLRYRF